MLKQLNVAVASMAVVSSAINLSGSYEDSHDADTGVSVKGNNHVKIDINFCLNIGEDGNCEGVEDAHETPEDDGEQPDGIDVTIDGQDLIENGEVVDDDESEADQETEEEKEEPEDEEEDPEEEDEEEMPDECQAICDEYTDCLKLA